MSNLNLIALYVYNAKKQEYEKPVLARIINKNAYELIIETDFLEVSPLWVSMLEEYYADYGLFCINKNLFRMKIK